MAATEAQLEVKILVDKNKKKVLYAEVSRDFVDVLFSFLTLPLGTIDRLVGKTQSRPTTVGCFGNLHQSVKSLNNEHFCHEVFKDMLLQPRSSSEDHCRRLKINIDDTDAKFFLCPLHEYIYCECSKFTSIYENIKCPNISACSRSMSIVKSLGASTGSSRVFLTKASKFIVTDDLQVTPVYPGVAMVLLNNLVVDDMHAIEERTVKLGLNEFLELLKLTLLSTTPLTDLFISKKISSLSSVLQKPSLLTKHCVDKSLEDGKINIKVFLKKSTKEFLFVEACQDFIDFLFSFLIFPLGEMLNIMDGQSCAGSVDGLYKSVLSLDSQYFISEDHRNLLATPKLPPILNRQNHLFPLESAPFSCNMGGFTRTMPVNCSLIGVEGSGGFLGDEAVFLVLDNLEVIPFSTASAISIFNKNNVSISGVEERTLCIGMVEGVSIMRASLNSSSAISNGLHNDLIFKETKQEK